VLDRLVLVRTFLGWKLVLEIEGRWPWQREALHAAATGSVMVHGPSVASKKLEAAG
jgi:hypothetical protein